MAEKVQILRKKISKIQLLFNFQKFDTKIFAKLLATKKKYLKMFEGLNDLKIEKKIRIDPMAEKVHILRKIIHKFNFYSILKFLIPKCL